MANYKYGYSDTSNDAIGKAGATVKQGVLNSFEVIKQIEAGLVSLVKNTVSETVKATGTVADVAVGVTKDVLAGTMGVIQETGAGFLEATKEIGKKVEEVAKVAVGGAIDAAGSIGEGTVRAVKSVSLSVVDGVKGVADAALPRSADHAAKQRSHTEVPPKK